MSKDLRIIEVRMYLPDRMVCIPGDTITEMVPLPGSGLPMVTYKEKGGNLHRIGGVPFEVVLEQPGAVEVVGAMPKLPRLS